MLDVKDGKALIITEKLIDNVAYHDYNTDVTWETCSLRKWMNQYFLNTAFTASERRKIAPLPDK